MSENPLFVYEVETRNFTFHGFAKSQASFERMFRKAWKNHCEVYGIPYDYNVAIGLVMDCRCMEVVEGAVYRDYDDDNNITEEV